MQALQEQRRAPPCPRDSPVPSVGTFGCRDLCWSPHHGGRGVLRGPASTPPPPAALPGTLQPGLVLRLTRAQAPALLPGLAVPPLDVSQPVRDPTGDRESRPGPLRLQPGGGRARGQRWGWCQQGVKEGARAKPGGGRGCVPMRGTHSTQHPPPWVAPPSWAVKGRDPLSLVGKQEEGTTAGYGWRAGMGTWR